MRYTPEGRGGEASVTGDVVAPHDAPIHEHLAQRGQIRGCQGARGQRLHGVSRDDVGGDGTQLAGVSVQQVRGHRLGPREPRELVTDQPETFAQIRGGAHHPRHREQPGSLAQPRLEGLAGA
jgi:hypothetical protein